MSSRTVTRCECIRRGLSEWDNEVTRVEVCRGLVVIEECV
jgi:hypothetical protein